MWRADVSSLVADRNYGTVGLEKIEMVPWVIAGDGVPVAGNREAGKQAGQVSHRLLDGNPGHGKLSRRPAGVLHAGDDRGEGFLARPKTDYCRFSISSTTSPIIAAMSPV